MILSIKQSTKLLLLTFVTFFSCKSNTYQDYEKISTKYNTDRNTVIREIKPDKQYMYWEYVYMMPGRIAGAKEILKKTGDSSIKKKYLIKDPVKGFFPECMPLYCYSYIMYIDQNKVHFVTDEKELKKFVGRIDNLGEALLISKINELWFDQDEFKAGSYKRTKNGYKLNLLKFYECPHKKEAIEVEIDSLGNFKSKNMGTYFKSNDCTIS